MSCIRKNTKILKKISQADLGIKKEIKKNYRININLSLKISLNWKIKETQKAFPFRDVYLNRLFFKVNKKRSIWKAKTLQSLQLKVFLGVGVWYGYLVFKVNAV